MGLTCRISPSSVKTMLSTRRFRSARSCADLPGRPRADPEGPARFSFDCLKSGMMPATFRGNCTDAPLEDNDSVSALCKHVFHRWVKSGSSDRGVPDVLWSQRQAQLSLLRRC